MDASVEIVKHLLPPVVHIHATVAREHPSTQILGNDRLGSGVVVDSSGLILTVNYVVMGAQSVEVAFAKARRARAEIVAQDFEVGLALLKVKRQGLRAAKLGNGEALEPGTAVIALASTGTQERRVAGGRGARRPGRSGRPAGGRPDRVAQRGGGGEPPRPLRAPLASRARRAPDPRGDA